MTIERKRGYTSFQGTKPVRLYLIDGGAVDVKPSQLGGLWKWVPGKGQVWVASDGAEFIRTKCEPTREAASLALTCEAGKAYAKKPHSAAPARHGKLGRVTDASEALGSESP